MHTSTLLSSGLVLNVGGQNGNAHSLATAEVFDPATCFTTSVGSLTTARALHSAVLLSDNTVLVCGGQELSNGTTYASCEIFNPTTQTWAPGTPMAYPRYQFTLTKLNTGAILAAGGISNSAVLNTAETYSSGAWTTSPNAMAWAVFLHSAILLPNNNVLVCGGSNGQLTFGQVTPLNTCQLYSSGSWVATGSMPSYRYGAQLVLLPSGLVFICGGLGAGSNSETYNTTNGVWTAIAPMNTARYYHTATLYSAQSVVVVVGGTADIVNGIQTAEAYSTATNKWYNLNPLNQARQ